jgi:chromosome segregation ATPase
MEKLLNKFGLYTKAQIRELNSLVDNAIDRVVRYVGLCKQKKDEIEKLKDENKRLMHSLRMCESFKSDYVSRIDNLNEEIKQLKLKLAKSKRRRRLNL